MLAIYPACPARAATARDPKFQPNLERTVRYLQDAQRENGGFAEPGSEPGADFSAWVTLALAAAGINPRNQATAPQHWVGGHSALTYLAEHAHEASLTTDFERELLVVDAAGASPHNFGGVNLTGEILNRQIATGSGEGAFPHEAGSQTPGVNDTIFAILSLSPIHESAVERAVEKATQWLEAQQKCDGSWNWNYTPRVSPCNPTERRLLPDEAKGEIDMTGAALEALNAVKHPDPEGQKRAFEYLGEGETANGGFLESLTEGEPNVASTAWVVQAMWSAAVNPETWLTRSGLATEEPLGYLASLQQEDGHIRYRTGEEMNGMWMTAYVTPAFTGNPLPIPEVPYVPLPMEPPSSAESGDGGVSPQPDSGVIAGGGGHIALLFSRPQPGSKGYTPGGVRQLQDQHKHEAKHRLNPGPARKAPAPTTISAGVHRPKKPNQAHHRGTGQVALHGAGSGGDGQSSGEEVKGVLFGASFDTAPEPDAPGLHGAGAGSRQTPWPAIGIGLAIALLAIAGSQLERRRPEVSL
jgi:hypothetical protein